MKLSNIILISLVGSISVVIIVGALQLRLTGELKSAYFNKEVDTIHLAPFRHLVIRKVWNLTIMPGDQPAIVSHRASGETEPVIHYHASGDTLYIDSVKLRSSAKSFWLSLHVPQRGLGFIHATNAHLNMMDYMGDELSVNLEDSRLFLNTAGTSMIGQLLLTETRGSVFEAQRVNFETVTIDLHGSRAAISGDVARLRASMKNRSTLRAPRATDIQLRKDLESTWQN